MLHLLAHQHHIVISIRTLERLCQKLREGGGVHCENDGEGQSCILCKVLDKCQKLHKHFVFTAEEE